METVCACRYCNDLMPCEPRGGPARGPDEASHAAHRFCAPCYRVLSTPDSLAGAPLGERLRAAGRRRVTTPPRGVTEGA